MSSSATGRLGALVDLAAVPLLVWAYGLATYGHYAILAAALTLGLGSIDLGLGAALQRVVPQAGAGAGALVSIALRTATLCAGALAVAAGIAAIGLDAPDLPAALLMAATLPFTVRTDVAGAAARARRAFGPELALRLFLEPASRLAFGLVLATMGASLTALALAHMMAAAATCWAMTRLARRTYPEPAVSPSVDTVRQMRRRGLALAPGALLRRALADGPLLLLSALVPGVAGAQAAALFALARKLASVPQMLRTLIASVMPPLAAAAHGAIDRRVLGDLVGGATRLAAVLSLPLGAALVAMTPPLLALMGQGLSAALGPALLLIAARTFESLAAPAAALMDTLADPREPLLIALGGALVWAAVAVLPLPMPPATAMAAAVACAVVAMSLAAVVRARPLAAGGRVRRAVAVATVTASIIAIAAVVATPFADAARVAAVAIAWLAGTWAALRWGLDPVDHAALGPMAAGLRLAPRRNLP